MAGSINKVILIGNVGKDPEIRSFQNGDRCANFSLACSESWKDKTTGEKKERTEWVRVAVFGSLVNVVEDYVKKGDKLYLSGKLQTRKWDKDGTTQYSTEVVLQGFGAELVMLGGPKGEKSETSDADEHRKASRGGGQSFELNDEIPF